MSLPLEQVENETLPSPDWEVSLFGRIHSSTGMVERVVKMQGEVVATPPVDDWTASFGKRRFHLAPVAEIPSRPSALERMHNLASRRRQAPRATTDYVEADDISLPPLADGTTLRGIEKLPRDEEWE